MNGRRDVVNVWRGCDSFRLLPHNGLSRDIRHWTTRVPILHPLFVLVDELRTLRAELSGTLDRLDRLIQKHNSGEPPDVAAAGFHDLPRTLAIEAVLGQSDHALRPIEIWEALRDAGRNDPKMEVQVTTFDLWQRGRIGKIGRGLYVSTPDAVRAGS